MTSSGSSRRNAATGCAGRSLRASPPWRSAAAGILLAATGAQARTWTDTQGRTVEADVVRINPDRTVVLKTADGKTVAAPFDAFSAADIAHLEARMALPFNLHPVPWRRMNELFGLPVWNGPTLWDDPTAEAARRMDLNPESKTDFMESHRDYPLGQRNVLGEPVFSAALYGGAETADSLSFVFLNLGDLPIGDDHASPALLKEMAERIEASGMRVHGALEAVLGKPRRTSLGRDGLREKVYRWDWNNHAILLSIQEGKYAALRILPAERADRSGGVDKLPANELKRRLASCVERRANGDVVVRNIPMIDQGPKGYCLPATWERYLRYLEIPADMYLLALAGNTGVGGGTYADDMAAATKSLVSANGRELAAVKGKPAPETVAPYIDQGLPLMWSFLSTPVFQQAVNARTAERKGERRQAGAAGQAEDTASGGHVCLVVGYNRASGEIAISDSWGPRFAERWVPAKEAQAAVTHRDMAVIKW